MNSTLTVMFWNFDTFATICKTSISERAMLGGGGPEGWCRVGRVAWGCLCGSTFDTVNRAPWAPKAPGATPRAFGASRRPWNNKRFSMPFTASRPVTQYLNITVKSPNRLTTGGTQLSSNRIAWPSVLQCSGIHGLHGLG